MSSICAPPENDNDNVNITTNSSVCVDNIAVSFQDTNATLNIIGSIDIPITSAVAIGTNASGVIAAATTSGTGSTIILQGTPTITTPVIDSISASAATRAA